jgi:branched-chain amino acid transport system substrate-binding protein
MIIWKIFMIIKNAFLSVLLLVALAQASRAQILVGQTAGFSGPVAAGVMETTQGAKLYINAINAKGGVHGQKIELVSLDDKFDPKLASENARVLIEEREVVALLLTRGTPHTQAMLPLIEKYGVPLVGPSSGAMILHQPVQKYVFNVRTSYQNEATKAVGQLGAMGIKRIGVVYVDDSFGTDVLLGLQRGFALANLQPVLTEQFNRNVPAFSPIADKVFQSHYCGDRPGGGRRPDGYSCRRLSCTDRDAFQ